MPAVVHSTVLHMGIRKHLLKILEEFGKSYFPLSA